MTDRELDERIAKAMGWVIYIDPAPYFTPWWVGVDGKATETPGDFSPPTSVDALRKWVLPEIKCRGLWGQYLGLIGRDYLPSGEPPPWFEYGRWLMTPHPPAVLAAAALEVLEATK